MADKTKVGFEQTIAQLLAASPKNSSKADPVKAWVKTAFNIGVGVARITEDKQLGNRITEQFAHKEPVVIFVLESGVNAVSLETKIIQRRYPTLDAVLLVRNHSKGQLSYEKLLTRVATPFSAWCLQVLNVDEMQFASESLLTTPGAEGATSDILAAIRTKPFILLAGISGTGKSRIVRQLARGCCPEKKDGQPHPLRDEQKPGNFELISVRPNWHDSTELMGYVTRITGTGRPKYVLTPFVKFLVKAWLHKDVPFFLCLDEMNLAPVEQYFAEYLSKIESRKLSGGDIVTDVLVEFNDEVCESAIEELLKPYKPVAGSPIPPEVTSLENAMRADKGIRIPSNLIVMGTVNMDETTCSFSRKVLDRAMSFELNDVENMYTISTDGDPDVEWGAFNNGVDNRAKQTYVTAENLYAEADATKKAANMAIGEKVLAYLKAINAVLDKTPFKVAYRTRNEMMLYCVERGGDLAKALDEVTSMKILSRIEGDENAVRVTNKLIESAAVVPTPLPNNAPKNLIQLLKLVILKQLGVVDGTVTDTAATLGSQEYETLEGKYKICAAKLDEMNDRLLSGYTGFWR